MHRTPASDSRFPDGFLWGAATAAHQVEGDNADSDWWEWEQAGHGAQPSLLAADSWNRWADDIAVAKELGLGVVRISVEWARIEPRRGAWDYKALEHYADILRGARSAGLKTMVVLWHFTNPAWFAAKGGWTSVGAPDLFGVYAGVVAEYLCDYVDFWATINEANTYALQGYIEGVWPPGRRRDVLGALRVYRGLADGHRLARAAIKQACGNETGVGLTHVFAWPHAASDGGALSAPMQIFWDWLANDLFMDRVQGVTDWIGVQYYHDSPCRTFGVADDDGHTPRTDTGWRIVPEGLYRVVMRAWRRYQLPIYITENGLADAADAQRERFLVDHLRWLRKAISEGADVRGYLHWSLIDNFEWAAGFGPRFGLAEVDYRTFARRIRPSARAYAAIVAANEVAADAAAGMTYADGTGQLGPEE
ncbi:MAG TPA: family 1 glycosylhydrolase [Coriobacteriia bacterium]|nr:family 1 glycosylhydrolase [Coriobacteriia bacterium]